MTLVFDTGKLPAAQRQQVVADVFGAVASVNVGFQCAPEEVNYRLERWHLGRVEMLRAGGFGGAHLNRSARLVRQHPAGLVIVSFQLRGSGFHAQNGYTREEAPGDLSVLDFAVPFEAGLSASACAGSVVIPAADLALPADVIRRAARGMASSPVYRLVQDHLARLSQDADGIADADAAAMVGRATTELVRALIVSAGRHDLSGDGEWHRTLETRLATYIDQHLKDRDLCAGELARVHHISVRQLFKLWARRDVSLSQWIIQQRLERAHADIAAVGNSRMTVATVAHRWGFTDTTHFSRRFRAAYSMSPREWRRLSWPASAPGPVPRGLVEEALTGDQGPAVVLDKLDHAG
jgi:AraC-like DNA-binding protein